MIVWVILKSRTSVSCLVPAPGTASAEAMDETRTIVQAHGETSRADRGSQDPPEREDFLVTALKVGGPSGVTAG